MLQGAGEEGEDVYRIALEVVEEGKTGGFLRLEGYEKKVEVGGRDHAVKSQAEELSSMWAETARTCRGLGSRQR